MDQNKVIEALKQAKEVGKKRNFSQSVDLIINLKDIDMKKPDQHVDFYTSLSHTFGKKVRVAGFVGPELIEEAKKVLDTVIIQEDFPKYKDKKKIKKLAETHNFFIAQANIMAQVATIFGKILGSRGKMPNPKAGCVVPPKTNLAPLYEKLQKTIRVKAKLLPVIQCIVGKEDTSDEHVAENIISIYNQLVHHLPNHENNINKVMVKLTMGKIVEIK